MHKKIFFEHRQKERENQRNKKITAQTKTAQWGVCHYSSLKNQNSEKQTQTNNNCFEYLFYISTENQLVGIFQLVEIEHF